MTQSRRILCFGALLAAALLLPGRAAAQVTIKPAPSGTTVAVNNGPGDHTDPHVSGNLVSYSFSDGTNFNVRYHDLVTNADNGVPNSGTYDFLADVSGSTIAFTRVSTTSAAIYTFNSAGGTLVEVDPSPGSSRQDAQIGRNTVAWQDNGSSGTSSDIIAYDTTTGTATNLTNNPTVLNQSPAISPDGNVIAWLKCAAVSAPCDIWTAVKGAVGWVTHQITNGNGACSHPDTNAQIVVYSCNRGTGDHLYWQPVAGGAEQNLGGVLSQESTPSIAGQFVSFSALTSNTSTTHDIYVLDLVSLSLYKISTTSGDNQLNDISITADGIVNVVWQVQQTNYAVYAYTFNLPMADLAIQKYGFPNTIHVGQGIAYGLVVHNLGPNTAISVVVSDPLPANTVFIGALPSQGSCTGPDVGSAGTVSCNLGNLINGGYAAVAIAVKVTGGAGTTITNTATVGANNFDPSPSDNSASVSTSVSP